MISTPDQRLRVFVSSTIAELADERTAARLAIERLRLTPVLFELGARPHPPRELYTAYLDQSDVFVGIYAESYGWVAPDEDESGIEQEWRLAGDRPRLVYVKHVDERHPRLEALLDEIRRDGQTSYVHFSSPDELETRLENDLAVMLSERFRPAPRSTRTTAALPGWPDRFIGRESELATLDRLLGDPATRFVTLLGPGGVGKTRLAVEAARTLASRSPGGVRMVGLAAVEDPALVLPSIAAALDVHQEHNLVDAIGAELGGERSLLVIDNLEQVVDAGPELAQLLAVSQVTILATSRRTLSVRGEQIVEVSPLPTSPEAGGASSAARLFVARAASVDPTFAHDPSSPEIAEIVRRLDGLPLAVEIAAARSRTLSPAILLERLGDRLDATAGMRDVPDRQRTLRATLDWSHALLPHEARRLLARFGTFRGDVSLEAVEAVCDLDHEGHLLDVLDDLVAQSLVVRSRDAAGYPRFSLLETVREYAVERLLESGEDEAVFAAHAAFVAELAARAGAGVRRTSEAAAWLDRVEEEIPDIRAVVERLLDEGATRAVVEILGHLQAYFLIRNQSHEGLEWIRRVLADDVGLDPEQRCTALSIAALLGFVRGGLEDDALAWANGAIELDAGPSATGLARGVAAVIQAGRGEMEAAEQLVEVASSGFESEGDTWGVLLAESLRARIQTSAGRGYPLDTAQAHVALSRSTSRFLEGVWLVFLGAAAIQTGRVDEARGHLDEALDIGEELGCPSIRLGALTWLAMVAVALGDGERAARLLAATAALRDALRIQIWRIMRPAYDHALGAVRGLLGDEAFEAAWREGATLRAEELVALAKQV